MYNNTSNTTPTSESKSKFKSEPKPEPGSTFSLTTGSVTSASSNQIQKNRRTSTASVPESLYNQHQSFLASSLYRDYRDWSLRFLKRHLDPNPNSSSVVLYEAVATTVITHCAVCVILLVVFRRHRHRYHRGLRSLTINNQKQHKNEISIYSTAQLCGPTYLQGSYLGRNGIRQQILPALKGQQKKSQYQHTKKETSVPLYEFEHCTTSPNRVNHKATANNKTSKSLRKRKHKYNGNSTTHTQTNQHRNFHPSNSISIMQAVTETTTETTLQCSTTVSDDDSAASPVSSPNQIMRSSRNTNKQLKHASSTDSLGSGGSNPIDPPILVYHENARSIVFRDHLRRASAKSKRMEQITGGEGDDKKFTTSNLATEIIDAKKESNIPFLMETRSDQDTNTDDTSSLNMEIAGFQPTIQPLPKLELGPSDQFDLLLQQQPATDTATNKDCTYTIAEREVLEMLKTQQCVVKTIKNNDWTSFLKRFHFPKTVGPGKRPILPPEHADVPAHGDRHFNSFVTSTSVLPEYGKKMRCYGSPSMYTSGVIFALPKHFGKGFESIDEAAVKSKVWSWPAGYSAKTEFNIDSRGNLVNGRHEAMVSLSILRQYNEDYLTKNDHMIAHRLVKGGFKTIPYNEVFVRVGGLGRIVCGKDCSTSTEKDEEKGSGRSFDVGLGLPVALFVRTATYGHLISLLRTRARLVHVLGESHLKDIPLFMITPELGTRVVTESLQHELLKTASRQLNPFQNPSIAHKIVIHHDDGGTDGAEELLPGQSSNNPFKSQVGVKDDAMEFEQKLEELIDLDDTMRKMLTPEECARIAGGFGCTDDSVAMILKDAMLRDKQVLNNKRKKKTESGTKQQEEISGAEKDISDHDDDEEEGHTLQDIVNEGLASAVRSGDYYTSRQLLILYTLVASMGNDDEEEAAEEEQQRQGADSLAGGNVKELQSLKGNTSQNKTLNLKATNNLPAPPPPPPLDTDRLRSATNCDGLLAVLGAAQVLKAMQDGSAKQRTEESVLALDEWVEHGESSMVFRLASWRNQRAAQCDLKIAMENNSDFMAFVSTKAISNRKKFSRQLRYAIDNTDFTNVRFLQTIHEICKNMHSPCLRLELLQYVLGLDNRYSVAHVQRSIQLAATCLSISS